MDQATNESTISGFLFHKSAFIDQLVTIDQSKSLIDYVNRFKTADTVIFMDTDELEVHAVIDYHKQGSETPGLAEHHAVLSLSHSAEWQEWSSISGRMFDQKAFARMLDINSDDITQPEAASKVDGINPPPFFILAIPVFAGEPKVDVRAMTKDSQDGNAALGLELVRTRMIIEAELARIAQKIESATSVPVILGSAKF
jgi:Uncharacterized conserved protein (DUF2303)